MREPGIEPTSSPMDADWPACAAERVEMVRFRSDRDGRKEMPSIGTYPGTSSTGARRRRDEARGKIEAGIDPGAQQRLTERAPDRTFQAVARHYLAGIEKKVLQKTLARDT
jgi:Arm DNA-binding domain